LKSGSLNLLEPYGPIQACNGIALPLPLPYTSMTFFKITSKYFNNNSKYFCTNHLHIFATDHTMTSFQAEKGSFNTKNKIH
jgi:hypothetical protein